MNLLKVKDLINTPLLFSTLTIDLIPTSMSHVNDSNFNLGSSYGVFTELYDFSLKGNLQLFDN